MVLSLCLAQSILRVQVENTMTIDRTVNSIYNNDEEGVEASSWNEDMVVVIELAAVNILDELAVDNLLRQLDGLLHQLDVGPDVNAAVRLLSDVRHIALRRGLENRLGEGIGRHGVNDT